MGLLTEGTTTIVTTETGSFYEIKDGFWRKNNGSINKTWFMYCVAEDIHEIKRLEGINAAWAAVHAAEELPLTVGMSMYIYGRHESYLSTPIVSIKEINSDRSNG
jgi:hypothetical protein